MAENKNEKRRIEGELVGRPIAVAGVTVTPVARLDGMLTRGPQERGEYEFGFLRVKPVRAIVSNGGGQEQTVAIRDVHDDIRRNMTIAGVLVAVASLAIMLVRKLK